MSGRGEDHQAGLHVGHPLYSCIIYPYTVIVVHKNLLILTIVVPRSVLNRCMAEFMKPSVNFNELGRLDRIRCIKELRTKMERKMSELLEEELEKSLDGIAEDG